MKTYLEQLHDHIAFLRSHGLDVGCLKFGGIIECRAIGQTDGPAELAYKSSQNEMKNGYVGVVTWCRAKGGRSETFKSYSLPPCENENHIHLPITGVCANADDESKYEEAARKAYGFWQNSSFSGFSCYLEHKKVGAYGVRFRSSQEYGNVAVVPMRDENCKLWSYQLLNPDRSKRMPKNSRVNGLFHALQSLIDGDSIGIAEGYVTAATCFEVSDISTVCAFSADNIPIVAKSLRERYPNSHLIVFADNDRHLEVKGAQNIGIVKAKEALTELKQNITIAIPDFSDLPPSKDASDWNDLKRLKGRDEVKRQMNSREKSR